ncbi:unnamed protein product [Ectocarpus sp. 12 AP-2014]
MYPPQQQHQMQQHQMQQHQMQQHQMQQHQMQQHQIRRHQQERMQMHHQHQQRMQQQQQQQQQILRARKKQVREKQQSKTDHGDTGGDEEAGGGEEGAEDDSEDDGEDEDDDDDDDDDEDDDDDDESFSSVSDLSDAQTEDTEAATESDEEPAPPPPKKEKARTKVRTKARTNARTSLKTVTTPKSSPTSTTEPCAEDLATGARASASADDITREMQKLVVNKASPARIPSSVAALSPAEYLYGVISDVLDTNNKKNFQRILSRTPIPIALVYLHQIAQKAIATGNREIYKVVIDTNKKYNIVSDLYIDTLAKGERNSISNAMDYLGKTVNAFKTGAPFNIDELLKFFTPEFIAMNLIQAGNIEAYDKVMTEFKNEEIRISRGFHVAKPLLAAYFGVPGFFSNQKRYTFNRDIIVLAICGGSVETLDYVIKKTKMGKISHDIVLEARSCQPIPGHMMKHLIEKYNVSEMSV